MTDENLGDLDLSGTDVAARIVLTRSTINSIALDRARLTADVVLMSCTVIHGLSASMTTGTGGLFINGTFVRRGLSLRQGQFSRIRVNKFHIRSIDGTNGSVDGLMSMMDCTFSGGIMLSGAHLGSFKVMRTRIGLRSKASPPVSDLPFELTDTRMFSK